MWEASVKARSDKDYTDAERNRMLLSEETRLGLKITGDIVQMII